MYDAILKRKPRLQKEEYYFFLLEQALREYAAASVLILKERMTPVMIAGILLTLAGLLLSEKRKAISR